jgi:hypothetical protein
MKTAIRFLLDNKCDDLILNDRRGLKPEDRIYASDIMEKFLIRTLSDEEIEKLNPHDIKENPASWYLWNDGFKAAIKELTKPKGRK